MGSFPKRDRYFSNQEITQSHHIVFTSIMINPHGNSTSRSDPPLSATLAIRYVLTVHEKASERAASHIPITQCFGSYQKCI